MEVERLRKDELMYELIVGRGCTKVTKETTVEKLREALKSAISREAKGEIFKEGELDPVEELAVCSAKLEEVYLFLENPEGGSTWRIRTLLYHLNPRLVRLLSHCTGAERHECKRLLKNLKTTTAQFKSLGTTRQYQAPSVVTVSTMQSVAGSNWGDESFCTRSVAGNGHRAQVNPADVALPSTNEKESSVRREDQRLNQSLSSSLAGLMLGSGTGAIPKVPRKSAKASSSSSNKAVAFHKWNVTFSGARDSSVNSFILRVEELADSRRVSDEDLLNGACEFFTGPALVWYRSVKNEITDWESLKTLLRKEFLPVDYQTSLIDEIRNRRQGVDEPSSAYIACMVGLFDRLEYVVPEKTKLEIIVRNMSPFYLNNLAWASIISLNHLKEEARTLEVRKSLVDRYENGNKNRDPLEPDLAYRRNPFLNPASKPFVPPAKPFVQTRRPVVHEVETPPEVPQSAPKVEAVSNPAYKPNFTCWNCLGEGHRFMDCPRPKHLFCHKCGRQGVLSQNCGCKTSRSGNAE